ncbi:MAG TPA: phage holin family protein [Chitinophagaceae bacterium]|nr:phage holin family protein [Chitinophagaceae bacterium]
MPTDKQSFFEETQDLVESYVNNRLRLFKLQTAEKSSRVVTLLFAGLVMGILSFFVLLFISIMAAYFFSEKFHSQFYGFGIVALIYILLLLIALYLRRKFLDKYVFGRVVKILFDSNTDDDEEEQD